MSRATTLATVYGVFMEPVGWKLAGLTWAYVLGWSLLTGFIMVHAYRLVSHRARWEERSVRRGVGGIMVLEARAGQDGSLMADGTQTGTRR